MQVVADQNKSNDNRHHIVLNFFKSELVELEGLANDVDGDLAEEQPFDVVECAAVAHHEGDQDLELENVLSVIDGFGQ